MGKRKQSRKALEEEKLRLEILKLKQDLLNSLIQAALPIITCILGYLAGRE